MEIPKEIANRFELGAKLQERPNCTVYTARDRELGGRQIAVKLFVDRPNGDQSLIESFEREVQQLRAASHQHLVPIIAGGHDQGWFYLAMELIDGPTLRDVIKSEGKPLALERAVAIMQSVAEGLQELHEHGLVHGHLDSRAIMFKGDQVRIAGFCPHTIDKVQRGMTSSGRLVIDPAYIAPEQVSSPDKLDARADVYAVGAMFFEMITGSKPFSANNPLQQAMMRLTAPAPSPAKLNPGVSPLIDAAVTKALAKEPAERFASVAAFADALTGGKAPAKNPLASAASEFSERMSTETIAVSMSTTQLKQMLAAHQQQEAAVSVASGGSASHGHVERDHTNGTGTNGSGDLDVASTAIGMPALGAVKASFVATGGPQQGKKWIMDRPQVMIGSDASCDIVCAGKGIPTRYAIVVQRGNDFYAGPLSPAGLSINGEQLQGTDEVLLKRGDVINCGAHALRFVAPGEVFTLKENVADRTIDRPQSRLHYFVMAVASVILVLSLGGVYMYNQSLEEHRLAQKKREAEKTQKREAVIAKLLREGDEFFKAGAFIEPVEANARARFSQVLELNPDHSYAKRRLDEISERLRTLEEDMRRREMMGQRVEQLLADADRYFRAGDYAYPPGKNAREIYQEVLRIDSTNETARKQIAAIDDLISDQLGRVQSMLARAQVYIDLGQYVEPPGENAYELLARVLKVSPGNEVATNALLDMAAYSIFEGDRAKAAAKAATMKKSYLTAQALGVDPAYIAPRLAGAKLMERSRASVIIYDRQDDASAGAVSKDAKDKGYLDTQEIERRVAALALKSQSDPSTQGRVFIKLGAK